MAINDKILISVLINFLTLLSLYYFHRKQYDHMEKQLKIQNDQLKIQNEQIKYGFFAEYTKRYQDIILHFPENINEGNFSYENISDKEAKNRILRYMRVYFDLCSEEYFLYKKRHLDETVWKEWEAGMSYAFNKPAFKKAWEIITRDSGFYKEFEDFVKSKMVHT